MYIVKVGATGDGSSWLTPMSLSAAFALNLDAGDIIHIAAGTYNPEKYCKWCHSCLLRLIKLLKLNRIS
jgi:hypothetical protein